VNAKFKVGENGLFYRRKRPHLRRFTCGGGLKIDALALAMTKVEESLS
jgi:hypothetical protein